MNCRGRRLSLLFFAHGRLALAVAAMMACGTEYAQTSESGESTQTSDPVDATTEGTSSTAEGASGSSTSTGAIETCGNGVVDPGEVCLGPFVQIVEGDVGRFRLADLNGDGRTDFVTAQGVFLQDDGGIFTSLAVAGLAGSPFGTGEFDDDGLVDLFTYDFEPGHVHRLSGDGQAGFDAPITTDIGQILGLTAIDLDGDGRTELLGLGSILNGPIEVWSPEDTGGFAPRASYPLSGFNVDVGDVDGDGAPDLAVAAVGLIQLRWGAPALEFTDGIDVTQPGLGGLALVDVDGDGTTEILLYSNESQLPGQTLNRLVVAWADRTPPDIWPFAAHDLADDELLGFPALGDMNRDGLADLLLVVRDSATNSRRLDVLCLNQGQELSVCASTQVDLHIDSLQTLHANPDGALDALVAVEGSGIWLMLADP